MTRRELWGKRIARWRELTAAIRAESSPASEVEAVAAAAAREGEEAESSLGRAAERRAASCCC